MTGLFHPHDSHPTITEEPSVHSFLLRREWEWSKEVLHLESKNLGSGHDSLLSNPKKGHPLTSHISFHPFILLSIYLFFINLPIYSSTYSPIHSSRCLFTLSLIHPFTLLSIHLVILPLIYLFPHRIYWYN